MTDPGAAEKLPTFLTTIGHLANPAVGGPIFLAIFAYGAWRAWQAAPAEPIGLKALRAIDGAFAKVEEVVLAFLLVGLIFIASYQAYKRNYAPPSPFWTDEVIRYSVFAIGLLGGALAAQTERLINIDMLSRLFSRRARLVLRLIVAAFTIYVCIMFIRGGFHVRAINIRNHEGGEVLSPAVGILTLPIGTALIGLHLVLHSIIDMYYLATGKQPPPEPKAVAV